MLLLVALLAQQLQTLQILLLSPHYAPAIHFIRFVMYFEEVAFATLHARKVVAKSDKTLYLVPIIVIPQTCSVLRRSAFLSF